MAAPTPEAIMDEFASAMTILQNLQHGEGRIRGQGSAFKNVVVEARVRLEQCLILLQRFRAAENEHGQIPFIPRDRRDTDREYALGAEIRLYGEAFYVFAWLVKESIDVLFRIEQIHLTFDPIGVHRVRHHLIEHPHKKDGAYVGFWTYRCAEGLILQHFAESADTKDEGLYPNAHEFITKLLKKLRACPLVSKQNPKVAEQEPRDLE
jgi:hypothetical protein